MKRLIVVLMVLCPVMAMGQVKASARAFPLTVHVVSSRIEPVSKNSTNAVRSVGLVNLLRVTIGGKKYLLAVLVYSGFWEGVRAVLLATLTGMVEPLGGVLGAGVVTLAHSLLPWGLAFAAGAMLFVVTDDIIPEIQPSAGHGRGTVELMLGLVVMLFLNVVLG